MAWYRDGTVRVTNGSATVTGTGTLWGDNKQGIGEGQMFLVPAAGAIQMYEILRIDSNTQLTLKDNFVGTSATSSVYAIPTFYSGSYHDFGRKLSAQLSYYQSQMDGWQQIMTGTGSVTLTTPNGQTVTISSFKKLTDDMNAKANKTDLGTVASKNTGTSVGNVRLVGDPATPINSVFDYNDRLMVLSTSSQLPGMPGSGQGSIINVPYASNNKYAMRWIGDTAGRAFIQALINGSFTDSFEICAIGKSVTVDGNGFIKKSSPIARLSYDPKKMQQDFTDGFKAAGAVSVNEEAEGVTGERIGVGIYRVIGSEGLAKEGWTVEIPQDVNGNRLIFVETEIADNGDITVSTFKRRFDPDSAMIVAGDPMDIPEGRWVDLRLQMPQKLHVVDTVPEEIEQ